MFNQLMNFFALSAMTVIGIPHVQKCFLAMDIWMEDNQMFHISRELVKLEQETGLTCI